MQSMQAMTKPKTCAHGIPADHSTLGADGRRIWRCSVCGGAGRGEGWVYRGTIECPRCWYAEVNEVRCLQCSGTKEK